MSAMIERQPFKDKIKEEVEQITPASVTVENVRAAAKKVLGEYGESALFKDEPDQAVALQEVLDLTNREGLPAKAIEDALNDVRRHVSIQAHFEAHGEHEKARQKAGWVERISLNVKDLKTALGSGIAEDVHNKEKKAFADPKKVQEMLKAATELAVMKHRLEKYTTAGGKHFKEAVEELMHGKVRADQLLNPADAHGKHYEHGLDNIIATLIPLEVGKTVTIDGLGDILIDTPETKAAIEHHLKFVLRTEVIKLAEASQMTVLSSNDYAVPHPTTSQKIWTVAKGIALSGTTWGIATRMGTRVLVGGLFGAAVVGSVGTLVVGAGVGIAAGAAGAWVRERLNAEGRLKRRRLEAALGGISNEAVKPASVLNHEMKAAVAKLYQTADAIEAATTPEDQAAADKAFAESIQKAFQVASEVQARLRVARTGKGDGRQDYISFGSENRFKAQNELLDNLEKTLANIQNALETLDPAQKADLQTKLATFYKGIEKNLETSKAALDKKIADDEAERRTRAMVIGGLAGGLGSVVSHFMLETFGEKVGKFVTRMVGEPATAAPVPELPVVPEQLVTVPGAEPVTAAGKTALLQTDATSRYTISMGADHQLHIAKLTPDGTRIESTVSAALPNSGDVQVVKGDHAAKIFDLQGRQIAEVKFTEVTNAAGNVPDQFFNDPETAKLLDAMGLQKGELQYDSTTKLFRIPDEALRDAAGKTEYLGRTAGWRARRMEFILKAMAEGKGNESPEMIVARAERATANLLLTKGELHNNPEAAFNEAFGKDASFIQKKVLPWVDGTRSRIGGRWMQVVAEMKQHPVGVSSVSHEGVTITPVHPDGSSVGGVVDTADLNDSTRLVTEAAVSKGGDFDVDFSRHNIIPLFGSILASAAVETVLYGAPQSKDVSAIPAHKNEYHGDDEHTVKDAGLVSVGDYSVYLKGEKDKAAAAEAAKVLAEKGPAIQKEITDFITAADTAIAGKAATPEAMDAVRSELAKGQALLAKEDSSIKYLDIDNADKKLQNWIAAQEAILNTAEVDKAKGEIEAFMTTADTEVGAKSAALEAIRSKLLSESLTADHITALVAEAGSFAEIQTKLGEAQALLAKVDGTVRYQDVDTGNGNKLQKWITTQEAVLKLGDEMKQKVQEKIEGQAIVITATRKDVIDKDVPTRRTELASHLAGLAFMDSLASLVPAVIPDTAWQTEMETKGKAAKDEAEQALAMLELAERIDADDDVKKRVNEYLESQGCFDAGDPTLPKPDKAKYIVKLAEKMTKFTKKKGKAGLKEMGFMTTVGAKSVKPEHEARIQQVLDRLFADEDDIFAA